MRITGVRTTLFHESTAMHAPARKDPTSLYGTGRLLVEVVAGPEISGSAIAPGSAAVAVERLARDLLVGEDARAAMSLWERTGNAHSPDDAASVLARAALDVAVWDLKARVNGEPLWKTLGGSRPRANAHLHPELLPTGADGVPAWYRTRAAETGICSASLAVSGDPEKDLTELSELKQILGPSLPQASLMVHFDRTVSPEDAIHYIRRLESTIDLTLVRSPVRPRDFRGARLVADVVAAAICMGRGLADRRAYQPFLEHYAANVLELDVALLGVSGILQMADAAFGFELPVMLSAHPGHLAVQLFSALPNAMSVAIDGGSVVGSTVTFESGRAVAGEEPGNGLVIDRDALKSSSPAETAR